MRSVLVFAVAAGVWIVATDGIADAVAAGDDDLLRRLQSVKGLLFVAGCSAIFAVLRRRELRRLESERASETRARDHQARYRAVVESSLAGLFWWRPDGAITAANDRFLATIGYTQDDVAAGRVRWDSITPPDWVPQDKALLPLILEQGSLPAFEKEFFRKDGTRVPVLIGAATTSGADAEGVAFVLDLTDLRDAQAALRRAETHVVRAQRMEAVGRLAGGIAHDFNNLLTVILGHCEMTLRRLPPDHPDRESIVQIERAGRRASELTRKLLAFSRRQVLDPVVMDVNGLFHELRDMVERVAGEDVKVEWRLAPDLPSVRADRSQIEQVWLNLVINARDAMPRGGRLVVTSSAVRLDEPAATAAGCPGPGTYVEVRIADTGVGMTEDVQRRVFEPFFTTKEPGRGTGLGLATVEGTVRQSGGGVTFTSEIGRGTEFRVLLPATDARPQSRAAASPPAVPDARGETVLLAEDADDLRRLVARILGVRGYRVLEARDADEALREAEAHDGPIHALVTDLVMPGLDGRALAERLRAARPSIGVVFVTGHGDGELSARGLRPGDVTWLRKPFTTDDLARRVRDAIEAAREGAEAPSRDV